jgi:hypothetical protein
VPSRLVRSVLAVAACAVLASSPPPVAAHPVQSDLDAFMAKVLASRDENWKKLQQYILSEREVIEVRGPSTVPIWGQASEYDWFIREGYFVRSPTKVDGVAIAEAERRQAEDRYLRRARVREKRAKQQAAEGGTDAAAGTADPAAPPAAGTGEPAAPPAAGADPGLDALLQQTRQPEFIDSAYFLRFKFEQGKYAFVGRETLDGREVLRVEYYPTRLFTHEQDDQRRRREQKRPNRNEDVEAAMERMMNKVSLVTLWIEPSAHQIVKYTFDNVNFDFLPAAWLLRVTDFTATMTMSQPFPDVWLPRDVDMYVSAMLAVGSFSVRYRLDYRDYRQAGTTGRIIRIGGGR